jgi:type VI secretion system secreted protein VgrG
VTGRAGDMSEQHQGDESGEVGEVADGLSGALEGISEALGEGEHNEDARRGLDAASDAAEAIGDAARTAEDIQEAASAFQRGDAGAGASGLVGAVGSAAGGVSAVSSGLSHVVTDPEARRALREVSRVASTIGSIARDVGEAFDGVTGLIEGVGGEGADVDYHVTIEGVSCQLNVTSVQLHERMSELSRATVDTQTQDPLSEPELIGKDVRLSIERDAEQRSFRGIIRSASVRQGNDGHHVSLEIVPAMYMMAQTVDSRIYQNLTVPELVEQLVEEMVGSRDRKVEVGDLQETYPRHEYLVQHHESHIQLITRLCDEEGIFFYFDHDYDEEEHEVLVLADANENRPMIRETFDGRVLYSSNGAQASRHETATSVHHREEIGATDAVVSGYDWSNPGSPVRSAKTGRGNWSGPPLEAHDHFDNVRHHEYSGTQYGRHTAERQAKIRTEQLDLARQHWSVESTVVSAAIGHTFALEGSEDRDGEYLIIGLFSHGEANREGVGVYRNTLQVVPKTMPYRPPPPARRMMPGPETATVVGPPGEEIHTDEHGRIKVQFHWDRRGQNDDHSSAWIRCTQGWAGPGWGMVFIPRIGMEVLVSFLGGDPDRPVVTGCLYNGQNTLPYPLPEEKTKSTIKTNSSLGGGGYNELRFEDKKGSEEVWIHAQKDFNEVVEHNHSTRVKNDQTNTVDHDQTETVGHDQKLRVKNNRTKTVDVDETNTITGNRTTTVGPEGGDETLYVKKKRYEQIEGAEDWEVVTTGSKYTDVDVGAYDIYTGGRFQVFSSDATVFECKENAYLQSYGNIQLKAGETKVHYFAHSNGQLDIKTQLATQIEAETRVNVKGKEKVFVASDSEIELTVGENTRIKLTPGEINIEAPTVKINGQNLVDIDSGGQVTIKC